MMDRRSALLLPISLAVSTAASCVSAPSPASANDDSPPSLAQLIQSANLKSPTTTPFIANPNPRAITTIRLDSPRKYAGLELYDVTIGNPPRGVVAVRSVRADGEGARSGAQRGMILMDFPDAKAVVKRVSAGPYPLELRLYNLALGGDAVGDLGEGIVSPEDALELAARTSGERVEKADAKKFAERQAFGGGAVGEGEEDGASQRAKQGFVIDTVRRARGKCAIQSRRGDTMEIRYEARVGDMFGPVYDSSSFRGTGQPYAYVLGNNDVIKGVDLGTYDMCPGEVRELSIPAELGYGSKGSRLFKQIGPNAQLWWRVELVALNFIKEGENDNPRDELYEGLTRGL
jgi:FK506-binding protein 2